MNHSYKRQFVILSGILISLITLSIIYFNIPYTYGSIDPVFLTISTFMYATISGFFIARQGAKYTTIRRGLAEYDGRMQDIYRSASGISQKLKEDMGTVLLKNYGKMLKHTSWDKGLFGAEMFLIQQLNAAIQNYFATSPEPIKNELQSRYLSNITSGFSHAQMIRKQLMLLREERITYFQWFLVQILAALLLFIISLTPSMGLLAASTVKAASVIAVLFVVIILHRLENLKLFEAIVGETSAQDLIDIISKDMKTCNAAHENTLANASHKHIKKYHQDTYPD